MGPVVMAIAKHAIDHDSPSSAHGYEWALWPAFVARVINRKVEVAASLPCN